MTYVVHPVFVACCKGPGYASPLEAMQNGPREGLFVHYVYHTSKEKQQRI